MREKMQKAVKDNPKTLEHLKRISILGTQAKPPIDGLQYIREIGQGAKQRCQNSQNVGFKNYGARGIEFKFDSVDDFAQHVLSQCGHRPTKQHSIDRVDNNGHYEPGNLRWATREEQQRNKRAYNGSVYGHRMQKLKLLRPDYTYEGLRKYVNLGYTDEQIIALEKPKGGRPKTRI
jgi:hypothetical protein